MFMLSTKKNTRLSVRRRDRIQLNIFTLSTKKKLDYE